MFKVTIYDVTKFIKKENDLATIEMGSTVYRLQRKIFNRKLFFLDFSKYITSVAKLTKDLAKVFPKFYYLCCSENLFLVLLENF